MATPTDTDAATPLGASAGQVQRQVLVRSVRLAGLGLLGGTFASYAVARAIASLLLATTPGVAKLSVRDLAVAAATGAHGATTVASTAVLAARAGIAVFATGGLGGVHRGASESYDESADLTTLSRTPIVVVCAGVNGANGPLAAGGGQGGECTTHPDPFGDGGDALGFESPARAGGPNKDNPQLSASANGPGGGAGSPGVILLRAPLGLNRVSIQGGAVLSPQPQVEALETVPGP